MANVLTTASTVSCGKKDLLALPPPPTHGGTVGTSSQAKLQVSGNPVLLQSGVAGKSVSGCTPPNDSSKSLVACQTVVSVTTGTSTKLKADNAPVLLDTLAGTTSGNPPGNLPATAGQTKLTAS
jgi:hypothetical protein